MSGTAGLVPGLRHVWGYRAPAVRRQTGTHSIFAGRLDEWAVARRLQAGAASYPPTSRLLIGRLPLLALGAALLTPPAVRGREGGQDSGDLGRIRKESFDAHNRYYGQVAVKRQDDADGALGNLAGDSQPPFGLAGDRADGVRRADLRAGLTCVPVPLQVHPGCRLGNCGLRSRVPRFAVPEGIARAGGRLVGATFHVPEQPQRLRRTGRPIPARGRVLSAKG